MERRQVEIVANDQNITIAIPNAIRSEQKKTPDTMLLVTISYYWT